MRSNCHYKQFEFYNYNDSVSVLRVGCMLVSKEFNLKILSCTCTLTRGEREREKKEAFDHLAMIIQKLVEPRVHERATR